MADRTEEYRLKKQAYKKEKRRYVTLWKRLGLVFFALSLMLTLMCGTALAFDNVTALLTGDRLWTLNHGDDQEIYYTSDYNTQEAWQAAAAALQLQIGGEGTVLLKNAEHALPLTSGTSVRLEGGSEALEQALQQVGFQVSADGQTVVAMVNAVTKQAYLTPLEDLKTEGKIQKLILLVTADAEPALWQKIPADGVLYFPVWSEELTAQILAGQIDPSGALAAPICADRTQDFESAYCAAVIAGEQTDYADQVSYPLGWGVHHTTFDYSTPQLAYAQGRFTFSVDVTNLGTVADKEILQLYVADPQGNLSLAGFEKTDILEAGMTQSLTISVAAENLSRSGHPEAGSYCFVAASNAHEAANHYLAALGHTPENTEGRMDAAGDPDMVAKWQQPDYLNSKIPIDTTKAPVMGAKNGMNLLALRGIPYDAPQWQQLLDQLTFQDMVSLVSDSGFYLPAVESVNAPGCRVDSGKAFLWKEAKVHAQTMLATTWNCDLAYEQGKLLADRYLNREIYMVSADQAGLCDDGDMHLRQTLRDAQAAGMGEKGVVATNVNEIAPAFGSWQRDLTQVSICDDLNFLPAIMELTQKKEDPAVLWALRNACHRNLYALVNSAAMNHMGADTLVTEKMPIAVWVLMGGAGVCWTAFVVFAVFWRKGKANWKNTQEYLDFKELKK